MTKLKTSVAPAPLNTVENNGISLGKLKGMPLTGRAKDNIIPLYPELEKQPVAKIVEKDRILDMNNPKHAFLDMFPAHVVDEDGVKKVVYVDDDRHPMNSRNLQRGGRTALDDSEHNDSKSWDCDW